MSVHKDVLDLDDDHPLNAKNVKSWIKTNKERLKHIRHYARSNDRKQRKEFQVVTNYVKNLQDYLRTGVYLDHRYGEDGDKPMYRVCYAKAYDSQGNVKRNIGTWYDDTGLWTREMQDIQDGT